MAFEIGRSIISGRKAVVAAGTAEPLAATSTYCYRIDLCADLGNDKPVVIGGSNVKAASGEQIGIVLVPGNPPITLIIDDVAKIYVDAQTNGDAVCYAYYIP
jgi:hypothetical protein